MRCGLVEEEEHTVARYLGGMRREIHDVVVVQQYWSYDVVFKLAIQLEKQMKTRSRRTGIEGSKQKNSWMTKDSSNSEPWKHEAPKTNAPENFTASKPKGIKCFKCSGIGHITSECPNRKILSLVEELGETNGMSKEMLPIFDDYGDNEEEEITWSDHRESLVIRRIMNVGKVEENPDWLWNNIFHTKCISHGKVCSVIINSDSCENIVL
ncbi:hypothetical protein CerSpe_268350 [Prunus speciosa]